MVYQEFMGKGATVVQEGSKVGYLISRVLDRRDLNAPSAGGYGRYQPSRAALIRGVVRGRPHRYGRPKRLSGSPSALSSKSAR